MMPPPLAPPAGLPVTPAAPGRPDTGRSPQGERHPASDGGDFTGLLALLGGIVPPPPAPPVVDAFGGDGPVPAAGAPAAPDAPEPDAPSLEALVSALAQQASGMSHPVPSEPDRARADRGPAEPDRAQASDRATAVAGLVDRSAAGPPAADAPAPGLPQGSTAPPPAPADRAVAPMADRAAPDRGGDTSSPPSPVAVNGATPPALTDRPDGGPSPVASPAPTPDGDVGATGSAVAALAHADRDGATRSPVAALAHADRDGATRSPVATLAQTDRESDAPSTDAPPAPTPSPGRAAGGRPSDRGGGNADSVPALTSDPAATGRSEQNSGAAGSSGSTGSSVAPPRRSPEGVPAPQTAPLPTPGPAPARPAEAITAPAETAPAATPAEVADQIVSAVVPLHGRGDGRHDLTLELRPEDLGAIRVEVSVEHQIVHLTLHAAEPATGRLLAAALPDLRSALADAGLRAGHVGVGPDGGRGTGQHRSTTGDRDHRSASPNRRAGGGDQGRGPGRADPVRPLRPAAAGRLDLFL